MEGSLCSLKWKSRMDDLHSVFLEFFQKELFCDVTLVTGKDRFKAHCFVLCAFSPYFKDILSSVSPGQYPVIFLKGTTSQEVKWLLDYLYTGEVLIPVASVEQFLSFGEYLGVSSLCESENSSENFVTPDSNNSLDLDNNQRNLSLTPDLALLCNKRSGENCQALGVKRPKTDKGLSNNKELHHWNQTPLSNQISVSTPEPPSLIIRSQVIIKKPNKKAQKNELSKLQLSLTQEELDLPFNNEELTSTNFFDESNILSSPPRRCSSVIFDIGNNSDRAAITQNVTQESVIFQENDGEEIVEISDDEIQNQGDGSTNQQCVSLVDSQSQMESDDSEIMIIRSDTSSERLSESSLSIPNVSRIKDLKVVLSRCLQDSENV